MSLSVLKYELGHPFRNVSLDLPKGAKILSVQNQRESICLWALVDIDEKKMEKRRFAIYGTGNILEENDDLNFLSTVQLNEGFLVFHIFEIMN